MAAKYRALRYLLFSYWIFSKSIRLPPHFLCLFSSTCYPWLILHSYYLSELHYPRQGPFPAGSSWTPLHFDHLKRPFFRFRPYQSPKTAHNWSYSSWSWYDWYLSTTEWKCIWRTWSDTSSSECPHSDVGTNKPYPFITVTCSDCACRLRSLPTTPFCFIR